jgi:hypothetical protein
VLERAVHESPDRGDCWAMLSMLYREDHARIQRAALIDRAWSRLAAQTSTRRQPTISPITRSPRRCSSGREFGVFRTSAERALALNSMDGFTAAYLGFQIACSGD